MTISLADIADRILEGGSITADEALEVACLPDPVTMELLFHANRLRKRFFGDAVHLCSIINAKSGRCPEDCAFCAQSARHETGVPVYPLVEEEEILRAANQAAAAGSRCLGIVTSGTGVEKGAEVERICSAVRRITVETEIRPACSLGIIDSETAAALRDAGLARYHHNLETARSFFPAICSTHEYEEDVATVRAVKAAGLEVCCGGIFGLGETPAQRVEFAFTLKELGVDSVPINFLNPIPGTRLSCIDCLTPTECLRIIALFRFVLPDKDLHVCGGRERNLRDLHSWIFFAGASGVMVGNYLTTAGRTTDLDRQMIRDLGLGIRKP